MHVTSNTHACMCVCVYIYTYVYVCGMNLSVLCDVSGLASEHYFLHNHFSLMPSSIFFTVPAAQGNLYDSMSKAAQARTRVRQNENVTI